MKFQSYDIINEWSWISFDFLCFCPWQLQMEQMQTVNSIITKCIKHDFFHYSHFQLLYFSIWVLIYFTQGVHLGLLILKSDRVHLWQSQMQIKFKPTWKGQCVCLISNLLWKRKPQCIMHRKISLLSIDGWYFFAKLVCSLIKWAEVPQIQNVNVMETQT